MKHMTAAMLLAGASGALAAEQTATVIKAGIVAAGEEHVYGPFAGILAAREEHVYGPFSSIGPSTIAMKGSGDADLYVQFGREPKRTDYWCRPYIATSNEKCSTDRARKEMYVKVIGYTGAKYEFTIKPRDYDAEKEEADAEEIEDEEDCGCGIEDEEDCGCGIEDEEDCGCGIEHEDEEDCGCGCGCDFW